MSDLSFGLHIWEAPECHLFSAQHSKHGKKAKRTKASVHMQRQNEKQGHDNHGACMVPID